MLLGPGGNLLLVLVGAYLPVQLADAGPIPIQFLALMQPCPGRALSCLQAQIQGSHWGGLHLGGSCMLSNAVLDAHRPTSLPAPEEDCIVRVDRRALMSTWKTHCLLSQAYYHCCSCCIVSFHARWERSGSPAGTIRHHL